MPVQSVTNPSRSNANPGGPPPTEICITIDTEFSIGGAFADPARYRPLSNELVDCTIDGRSEGLDFLLHILRDFRAHATFFVEVLQCFYFGERPMGRIIDWSDNPDAAHSSKNPCDCHLSAAALCRDAERRLAELATRLGPVPDHARIDLGSLYEGNLISGVVSGLDSRKLASEADAG